MIEKVDESPQEISKDQIQRLQQIGELEEGLTKSLGRKLVDTARADVGQLMKGAAHRLRNKGRGLESTKLKTLKEQFLYEAFTGDPDPNNLPKIERDDRRYANTIEEMVGKFMRELHGMQPPLWMGIEKRPLAEQLKELGSALKAIHNLLDGDPRFKLSDFNTWLWRSMGASYNSIGCYEAATVLIPIIVRLADLMRNEEHRNFFLDNYRKTSDTIFDGDPNADKKRFRVPYTIPGINKPVLILNVTPFFADGTLKITGGKELYKKKRQRRGY